MKSRSKIAGRPFFDYNCTKQLLWYYRPSSKVLLRNPANRDMGGTASHMERMRRYYPEPCLPDACAIHTKCRQARVRQRVSSLGSCGSFDSFVNCLLFVRLRSGMGLSLGSLSSFGSALYINIQMVMSVVVSEQHQLMETLAAVWGIHASCLEVLAPTRS